MEWFKMYNYKDHESIVSMVYSLYFKSFKVTPSLCTLLLCVCKTMHIVKSADKHNIGTALLKFPLTFSASISNCTPNVTTYLAALLNKFFYNCESLRNCSAEI